MQTKPFFGHKAKLLSIILSFLTIIIVVHKIDFFNSLHIIPSLKILYVIFFALCAYIFFYCFKNKKILSFFKITALSVIILLLSFFFTNAIHYIFYLFIGLWIIGLGSYIIHAINTKRQITSDFTDAKLSNKAVFTPLNIIFISCIVLSFLFFGLLHLNKGSFVDEKLWTYGVEKRIEKYWNNILERDWKNTRPSDKPGVTLAIVSGIGLLQTTPSDFYHNYDDGPTLSHMLYTMRLPIVVFCALMLIPFFYLIHKTFDQKVAVFALLFIGFSPILIGISRLINPDALSWALMSLTFIGYFLYLKSRKTPWLYVTGALLGLSLLTKYIANLFIIFFIIEIFTGYIFIKKDVQPYIYLRNKIFDVGIIIFIALAVFYILFPGTWLVPDRLLLATIWSQAFIPVWKPFVILCLLFLVEHFFFKSIISIWILKKIKQFRLFFVYCIPSLFLAAIMLTIFNTTTHMILSDIELLLAAPKSNSLFSSLSIFSSGFYVMIYSISPLALIGILFTIRSLYMKKTPVFEQFFLWHSILFIIIFYLGSAVSLVAATVRYQIILYPLFFIMSAYGWSHVTQNIKYQKTHLIIAGIITMTSFYTLWSIKPFYSSYSSSLLPSAYIVNPKDMGDGSYEIAEYLNNLPNAENLKIWSDKNGVCVFFDGYCNSRPHMGEFDENDSDFDYYIISRGSEYRITHLTQQRLATDPHYPLRLDRLYTQSKSVYELSPGNRPANYIRVISGKNLVILETNYETH